MNKLDNGRFLIPGELVPKAARAIAASVGILQPKTGADSVWNADSEIGAETLSTDEE